MSLANRAKKGPKSRASLVRLSKKSLLVSCSYCVSVNMEEGILKHLVRKNALFGPQVRKLDQVAPVASPDRQPFRIMN